MSWRTRGFASSGPFFVLALVGSISNPRNAAAEIIDFSGTVSYSGPHSGDTLFVAVLDTTGVEDVAVLALEAIEVGPPPFDQNYSLGFDNSGVGELLFVVSFLDVGGGGVESLNGEDVFGWYAGGSTPTEVSSNQSQSGLDFDLPRAEIHGTITFAPGQAEAWVDVSTDPLCALEGFRPYSNLYGSGPYAINGIYPGTYCISAAGYGPSLPNLIVCYGDPSCASPTLVTLTETEVRTGVDLDFTDLVPAQRTSWGRLKSRYP